MVRSARYGRSISFQAIVLLFLIWHVTFADTTGPRFKAGPATPAIKVKPGTDFTDVPLRGCIFQGLDLSHARFDGCDLEGVTFDQCNLSFASFRGANLRGMAVKDVCNLWKAVFTDAKINGMVQILASSSPALPEFHLSEDQLKSTASYKTKNLSDCYISAFGQSDDGNLTGGSPVFNFTNFDLRNSVWDGGDFTRCVFDDAVINGCVFRAAFVEFSQLKRTLSFKNRTFQGVKIWKQSVVGILDFTNCVLRDARVDARSSRSRETWPSLETQAVFVDAVIDGGIISGMSFEQLSTTASYKQGRVINAKFSNADFSKADFSGINFSNCTFFNCKFAAANLNNAVLSGVSFEGTTIGLTNEQVSSTWNFKNDRMDTVQLPR